MTYRIVRRAFSQHTVVEEFTGSWVDAMNRSMSLEAANRDGEYSIRAEGEPLRSQANPSYQSGLDWL